MILRRGATLMRKPIVLWLIAGAAVIFIATFVYLSGPTTYRFRIEAAFTFDGQPYTAIGYTQCTYRRAWLTPGSDRFRLGDPIYEGYTTTTWRDSPSVVLPDGKGAIVFQHSGSCPPLPVLRVKYVRQPPTTIGGTWPAYYFPDRNDPKVVWVLADRNRVPGSDTKRYFLKHYFFVRDEGEPASSLAQNVPAAWEWYEKISEQYRSGMKSINGFKQSEEAVWRGIFGCVLHEDEWKGIPEFVQFAATLNVTSTVTINQPGGNWARNCNSRRTEHISLVPSEDYSKATIDLDRGDLRWATITTPYLSQYRDRDTTWWTPEICVAGEACTGFHPHVATWLYLSNRRVFIRLEQEPLETYRFSYFALRPGDGL